jgi:Flp pilus assembly protein TadB
MNDNQNTNGYGEIRIGDAERNEAVRLLGEHFEAGRLSQEEHSERVDKALQARTRKDLDALFGDLPRDADPGWQGPGGLNQQGGRQDGPRGPFGLPVPLTAILALAAVAGIVCAVVGGHPPVLLFAVIAATAFIVLRRRGAFRA